MIPRPRLVIRWPKVLTEGDFRSWRYAYGKWEKRALDFWWSRRFGR